jgi:hypothetical protein
MDNSTQHIWFRMVNSTICNRFWARSKSFWKTLKNCYFVSMNLWNLEHEHGQRKIRYLIGVLLLKSEWGSENYLPLVLCFHWWYWNQEECGILKKEWKCYEKWLDITLWRKYFSYLLALLLSWKLIIFLHNVMVIFPFQACIYFVWNK